MQAKYVKDKLKFEQNIDDAILLATIVIVAAVWWLS